MLEGAPVLSCRRTLGALSCVDCKITRVTWKRRFGPKTIPSKRLRSPFERDGGALSCVEVHDKIVGDGAIRLRPHRYGVIVRTAAPGSLSLVASRYNASK